MAKILSILSENHIATTSSMLNLPEIILEMGNKPLNLPKLPEPILLLRFMDVGEPFQEDFTYYKNSMKLSESDTVEVQILSIERLTVADTSVKKTLHFKCKFQNNKIISFEPGDSFGFICSNSTKEVEVIIERLKLQDICDIPFELISAAGKKNLAHISPFSTLKLVLSKCVDLRAVPKKVVLRLLAAYCTIEKEKVILEVLSSQEGAAYYEEYIRKPSLTILDVLAMFQSCEIPVERLLEFLPSLKPRYYSVASSPLASDDSFNIVFNVIEMNKEQRHHFKRKGLCTGWFEEVYEELRCRYSTSSENLNTELRLNNTHENTSLDLSKLSITENECIPDKALIFKRQNLFFRLPKDDSLPIILIGPGTGVAPFIGFLQHRELQMEGATKTKFGETWLFYGCRHKNKDYLFSSDLERFHACGVLSHLIVCFSRDEHSHVEQPRRVQDNIIANAMPVVSAIDSGAVVYICGDAKHMAKDVEKAFVDVLQIVKNLTVEESRLFLKQLVKDQRYILDVWT